MSVRTYRVSREGDRLLSPHFRVREFACRDGSDLVKIDTDLVELLERIRAAAGGAVTISSGYRTASHNQKVGVARYSQHLLGTAADITVSGVAPLEIARYAEFLMPDSGGIGVYQTFCHVDVRSTRSRWDSRSGKEVVVSGWPGYEEESEVDLAVSWAKETGIITGYADGEMHLDDPVTRRQLLLVSWRLAKLTGLAKED